mmetsp:Transcript_20802/g.48974  ORF Transcript_20802/g.48974 Transcript_20802/m.48974 type:complete len:129 (-) Transcript_20802:247-633(-)
MLLSATAAPKGKLQNRAAQPPMKQGPRVAAKSSVVPEASLGSARSIICIRGLKPPPPTGWIDSPMRLARSLWPCSPPGLPVNSPACKVPISLQPSEKAQQPRQGLGHMPLKQQSHPSRSNVINGEPAG